MKLYPTGDCDFHVRGAFDLRTTEDDSDEYQKTKFTSDARSTLRYEGRPGR